MTNIKTDKVVSIFYQYTGLRWFRKSDHIEYISHISGKWAWF